MVEFIFIISIYLLIMYLLIIAFLKTLSSKKNSILCVKRHLKKETKASIIIDIHTIKGKDIVFMYASLNNKFLVFNENKGGVYVSLHKSPTATPIKYKVALLSYLKLLTPKTVKFNTVKECVSE